MIKATPFIDLAAASRIMLRVHNAGGDVHTGIVHYSLVPNKGQLLCVIPDSAGMRDVFSTLHYWRVGCTFHGQSMKIHDGFLEQAQTIINHVSHCDAFIGHSFGGALAQVLAARLRKPVITFGSPRVGNSAFARAINRFHVRVVGSGDALTHAPAWWRGYRHGGTVARISTVDRPWWKAWSLNDHIMSDYLIIDRKTAEADEYLP